MDRTFLVAGGDLRMKYAAGRLAEGSSNSVYLTGNIFNSELPDRVNIQMTFPVQAQILIILCSRLLPQWTGKL